jgi:hypothetical protein
MQTERDYVFHMLTQFSEQSNGEATPAYNIDGILPVDTHVSPIQLNMAPFNEVNVSFI